MKDCGKLKVRLTEKSMPGIIDMAEHSRLARDIALWYIDLIWDSICALQSICIRGSVQA